MASVYRKLGGTRKIIKGNKGLFQAKSSVFGGREADILSGRLPH